jgi:hypothetical protein
MWDQVKELLKQYESAHIIEIDDAINAFCGFVDHDTNSRFLAETQALLHYRRTPFCMMEGSNNAPLFSQVLPTPSHCYTTCRAAAVSLLHHLSCCCRLIATPPVVLLPSHCYTTCRAAAESPVSSH